MRGHLHRLELIVELDVQLEPITGLITDAHGHHRPFCGWLDLMEVLDAARHPADVLPDHTASRPPSEGIE